MRTYFVISYPIGCYASPEAGDALIRQTALFDPVGLGGLIYWYGLWVIHQWVFAGLLRSLVREATTR